MRISVLLTFREIFLYLVFHPTKQAISCSTVSKAFGKSTKTPHPNLSLSSPFLIFSVKLISTWFVE